MRRVLAAAAVALTATTGSADGAARLTVRTTPALTPSYSAGVPDYTVRCKPGTPVRVKASVPPRQSLSVDGQPAAEGSLTQDVNLEPGQAFTFTVNGAATHNVRCVPSDFPSWRVQRRGRPVAQWTVFAPTLKQFPPPNPPYSVISDRHGVPVWWKRADGATPLDTRLLPDGTVTWGRLGGGFSQTYWDHVALDGTPLDPFNTVGIGADHHDFQMLPNGNHLMIADTAREHVDLRRFGGPRDATVIDATVQELAPDGSLVWSWSTKDHIRLSETTAWGYKHARFEFYGKPAYDLTHLNAIDLHGNVLVISCRKLRAVYGVSRTDGRILWKMGGTHRPESLTLKRDPYGKRNFGGQHSVRRAPDGTIYLHDNGSLVRSRARVVRYRLNLRKRTATLIESIDSGKHSLYSFCCGSAQLLPKGHWLISWGGNPIITELDHRHRPVLTLRFPGKLFSYWAQAVMPGLVTIDQLRAGMDAQFPREPQASP
jgi:Arylsulfotransferase (ASST)